MVPTRRWKVRKAVEVPRVVRNAVTGGNAVVSARAASQWMGYGERKVLDVAGEAGPG